MIFDYVNAEERLSYCMSKAIFIKRLGHRRKANIYIRKKLMDKCKEEDFNLSIS